MLLLMKVNRIHGLNYMIYLVFIKEYTNMGLLLSILCSTYQEGKFISSFKSTNYNLISLLSRTNDANQEFQEDTYLDMFIYRTGKNMVRKQLA